MRFCLSNIVVMCALLCTSLATAQAEDKHVLVVNDSGYYLMVTPSDGVPRFEKIDVVIDVTKNGGGPSTPTTPGGDPVAKEVTSLCSGKPQKDAAALAAVYQFFADKLSSGAMDKAGFDIGFATARRIASTQLAGKWDDVFASLDSKMGTAPDLAAYLKSCADGFGNYAGESAPDILANNDVEEALDPMSIMAIIEAIINLLKLLGVLKG